MYQLFDNMFWHSNTKKLRGAVVTPPPLNRKVGCSRPTIIRARCLRVRQHYPAQKNNQKKLHVVLKQGHNSGSPWWAVQLVCWSYPSWINDLKKTQFMHFSFIKWTEKAICFKQRYNKIKSFSEIFQLNISHNISKILYLLIFWLYVFNFFKCKFNVEAFSLLYSKLLYAKLCLFVFDATFAASRWQFVSICSCFIRD